MHTFYCADDIVFSIKFLEASAIKEDIREIVLFAEFPTTNITIFLQVEVLVIEYCFKYNGIYRNTSTVYTIK